MKTSLLLSLIMFSVVSHAKQFVFPTPKTLGPMKHEVIYYSAKIKKVEEDDKAVWFERVAILQWGTKVFERGVVTYYCEKSKTRCLIHNFEGVATYEKCVVDKNKVARCYEPLTADYPSRGEDGERTRYDGRGKFYEDDDYYPSRPPEREIPDPHLDEEGDGRRYDPPDDGYDDRGPWV